MLTTQKADPIANLTPEEKAQLVKRFERFRDNLNIAMELRREVAITSNLRRSNPLIKGF